MDRESSLDLPLSLASTSPNDTDMKNPAIIHFPTEDAFVEKFGRSKYLEGVHVPRIGEITNLMSKVYNYG